MFGWFGKRLRREHIKLVRQNQLAVEYLHGFAQEVYGHTLDPSMMRELEEIASIQVELISLPKEQAELDHSVSDDQLKLHKQLRRLYDEQKAGKVAFAQRFGSAREKLNTFDQRFETNEGWKVYLDHFGPPNSAR